MLRRMPLVLIAGLAPFAPLGNGNSLNARRDPPRLVGSDAIQSHEGVYHVHGLMVANASAYLVDDQAAYVHNQSTAGNPESTPPSDADVAVLISNKVVSQDRGSRMFRAKYRNQEILVWEPKPNAVKKEADALNTDLESARIQLLEFGSAILIRTLPDDDPVLIRRLLVPRIVKLVPSEGQGEGRLVLALTPVSGIVLERTTNLRSEFSPVPVTEGLVNPIMRYFEELDARGVILVDVELSNFLLTEDRVIPLNPSTMPRRQAIGEGTIAEGTTMVEHGAKVIQSLRRLMPDSPPPERGKNKNKS